MEPEQIESYRVEAFEVICPGCTDLIELDESNFEFDKDKKQTQQVECEFCNEKFIAIHPDY